MSHVPLPQPAPVRVAYLNTEYPALSHTFIEREIRAVRALGVCVETFSVRRPGQHSRLGEAHEKAAHETFYILDGLAPMVSSVFRALVASPAGFLRALVASQQLAPPGLKSRVTHVAYACEGMRLAYELRRRKLGHLHVHMANSGTAVAMMACRYAPSLRYSISIHGSAEFFHVDSWRLAPKAEGAMFVRCISDFCRAQVMTWTNPRVWDNFHIVHCGIESAVYLPRPARQPGPLRLITVGRLHPIKGYHLLLDAVAALARDGLIVDLDMVGDGPERAALEKRAQVLGLGGRVRFSGAVSQEAIGGHYDHADAMVVSSFMEGVPVVLMEAMAKELGVVATRVGGVPELVEEDVSGILVNAGSADALVASIRVLVADPDLCRRQGVAGRKRVLAEYSLDQVGAGMVGLFKKYLGDAAQ
jgi:colanic acid/amylovoran biosynthesis glycosyltransferase